ncbi:MAG: dephospho-CoA kinase [Ignavibacteriaceae bacterium]
MTEKKLRVGVTGNIGAGKSTFSKFLVDAGYPVINADREAKRILESDPVVKSRIKNVFGEKSYRNDQPDTEYLASLVFSDEKNQQKINSIIHPVVINKINILADELEKQSGIVFIEAALIYESELHQFLDYVVLITSNAELRLKRKAGAGMTAEDFRRRDAMQIPEQEKTKMADFVISNDGTLPEFKEKAEFLLKVLNSLVSVKNSG